MHNFVQPGAHFVQWYDFFPIILFSFHLLFLSLFLSIYIFVVRTEAYLLRFAHDETAIPKGKLTEESPEESRYRVTHTLRKDVSYASVCETGSTFFFCMLIETLKLLSLPKEPGVETFGNDIMNAIFKKENVFIVIKDKDLRDGINGNEIDSLIYDYDYKDDVCLWGEGSIFVMVPMMNLLN